MNRDMVVEINVNNVPDYAEGYKCIVAKVVGSEFYFYGAWNNLLRAREVAAEIGGVVLKNVD